MKPTFLPKVFAVYRVTGQSMIPVLADGDYVLTTQLKKPETGTMVVVDHQQYGAMVKRVKETSEDQVLLTGENNASIDSSVLGWINKECILGTVFFYIKK